MIRNIFILILFLFSKDSIGQLFVARDTICVIENNYVLKMPWANGINYSNISSTDLNYDGKKDLVVYDRLNNFGAGRFRCFINNGSSGQTKYLSAPELSYYFPQVYGWAILLDYNCDAKEDLFCYTSLGIMVYKNVSSPANPVQFVIADTLLESNYNPGGNPTYGNIFASSVGVPGISDIDNDGDLDILTFSPGGSLIEYHKNIRVESNLSCEALKFEYSDNCWGKISEGACSTDLNSNFCNSQKPNISQPIYLNNKIYHAGSCLTCIDSDGDGDKDLILGDISCNTSQYLHNTGTINNALFSDTTKLYPNYPNKNNTTQIKLNNYPCTYYLDVDGDNKKDLIATPNSPASENFKSVWFYKNTSTTNTVNFQFIKNNFLQDEMIEVGQNSFPVLIDYNADGLKDLIIGTHGYYLNSQQNPLSARLTLYQNIGTLAQPVYSLITRDYAGLSSYSFINQIMPTVGDVDNDNDVDICFGTSSGQIHWLENTAGANNLCNFSILHNNSFSITTISSSAAPQLFDLDKDGKLDLIIGTKNGKLSFYKNISPVSSSPSFSLLSSFLGNVDVKNNPNVYGIDGYAVPYFYNEGAITKLLVGSVGGTIYYYSLPNNINSNFNFIRSDVNFLNEGGQSAICFDDVNNDNLRDLFIGNASGGLSFYSSKSPLVIIKEFTFDQLLKNMSVFPNPVNELINININDLEFDEGHLIINDMLGQTVLIQNNLINNQTISLNHLAPGIYFIKTTIKIKSQVVEVTKKIIKN